MKLTALVALGLLSVIGLTACGAERKTEAHIKKAVARDKIVDIAERTPASEPAKSPEPRVEADAPRPPPAPPPIGRKHSPAVQVNQTRLYREPVEMYWNDWFGTLIRNDLGQAYVAIEGAGKSVGFFGIISMNCENGRYTWEGARWFIENAINAKGDLIDPDIVPSAVIAEVRNRYCPDQPPA